MRQLCSAITLCTATLLLVGCGQSGSLYLASDPNYDKRANYLLYPNVDKKAQQSKVSAQPQQDQIQTQISQVDAHDAASTAVTTP